MDVYEIRLERHLSERVGLALDCDRPDNRPSGEAVLTSRPLDQAGLHGLLARLRDLNIGIVSIRRIDHPRGEGRL